MRGQPLGYERRRTALAAKNSIPSRSRQPYDGATSVENPLPIRANRRDVACALLWSLPFGSLVRNFEICRWGTYPMIQRLHNGSCGTQFDRGRISGQ